MQGNMSVPLIASEGLAFHLKVVDMHAQDIEVCE